MVKTKVLEDNLIYTYSDKGMRIERDGVPYDDAIDPVEFGRTYKEVCESHCTEIGREEIV